jgi:putative aldouronate transport system substrate-binding protein
MEVYMKKIAMLAILVLLLVQVGVFAGQKPSEPAPAADTGPYWFTYTYGWGVDQGAIPPSEAPNDPHFQYVSKTLGIAPLTQPYDWGGGTGYEQSVRMQLSGGDIPEAMQLYSSEFTQELMETGVLMALDDLLPKYAPKIWNLFSEKQWELVRSFSPDRKIYFVPKIDNVPRIGMIRIDWLREVGINKVPETKEELLAAYRAFKAQDANGNGDPNDEIPVSGREHMRWCDDLFVMFGCAEHEGWPEWRWDPVKKIMISDQVSDNMKNAVIFIRQLVDEGLMDPVMPIQQASDWFAKLGDDKIGHYFHTIGGIPRRLAMRESGQNPDAEWVYMPNVKVEGVPHQPNYAPGMGIGYGITTEARDPGKILQWMDWNLSEEGRRYYDFGIEGVNYVMDGDKITYPDGIVPISNKHRYAADITGQGIDAFKNMPFGDILAAVYEASKNDVQYRDTMMMPASVYEDYDDYAPSVASLFREKVAKMILSELPMSAWDDYVAEWYAKGGTVVQQRVTDWYKATYNIK